MGERGTGRISAGVEAEGKRGMKELKSPRYVLEAVLYARDLAAAESFYVGVLGLERAGAREGEYVLFRCGPTMLLVFNPEASRQADRGVPAHGATGAGHAALAVPEAELARWRQRLIASGVAIEQEVSWPGGGGSIYFRDPANNSVELATPRIWGLAEPADWADGEDPG